MEAPSAASVLVCIAIGLVSNTAILSLCLPRHLLWLVGPIFMAQWITWWLLFCIFLGAKRR